MGFYIDRNEGAIVGIYSVRQREGQEMLPEDDDEVVAFRAAMVAPADLSPLERLSAVGLTVDDLKQLLGLA